jgi:Pyruvate/2-oxoacid:ferredoxin oxidoreductase gamma subunit
MAQRGGKSFLIAADDIAKEKNMIQASNMALLGFLSYFQVGPYTYKGVLDTLKERTKGKFLDKNVEIFQTGYKKAVDMGISS